MLTWSIAVHPSSKHRANQLPCFPKDVSCSCTSQLKPIEHLLGNVSLRPTACGCFVADSVNVRHGDKKCNTTGLQSATSDFGETKFGTISPHRAQQRLDPYHDANTRILKKIPLRDIGTTVRILLITLGHAKSWSSL